MYTWFTGSPLTITGLVLHLDAGNTSSYPGTGTTWTDLVSSKTFTLSGSPTYSTNNGGYFNFNPASYQCAYSTTGLSTLTKWSVEAWHYYTGTNAGTDAGGIGACIVTETFTGTPNVINYSLGNNLEGTSGVASNLYSGFYDASWETTPAGYSLSANNWYHIMGTYDGATNKLYVNGSLVGSVNYTGTPSSGGHGIRLMRRWDNPDYWGGRLSIVRIYNNALSALQITNNFNAQRARFGI
jgi:Concanavalin A-like lectin/glucanases superfamily